MRFEKRHKALLEALLGGLNPYAKYRNDPVAFAKEVLHCYLTPQQEQVLNALIKHKQVLVKSANGIGKTKLAAITAEWFHLCFDIGECVVTGPRAEQLGDTTFKEIRKLHGNRPGIYPAANLIKTSPDHYIRGTTAKDSTAFQGIHSSNILIIFEECTGVEAQYWEGARGIMAGGNCYWLAICNPTDNSSQAYIEEQSGQWEVISISALDHPNIVNELQGLPPVIPSAVRLEQLKRNMDEWGTWVKEEHATLTDVKFEEKDQPVRYWRPGPIGEARILGRYPSQAAYSIFGESDFVIASSFDEEAEDFFAEIFRQVAEGKNPKAGFPDRFGQHLVPQFGCDVARFGDDRTTIHGRIGKYSFLHEWHNGQDTEWTANRLKQLCNEWGKIFGIAPTKIPVKVDDTGVGGGVTDQRGDYYFIPINAASLAIEDLGYPNKRSELLFNAAQMMRAGDLRLTTKYLDKQSIVDLQRQALSVTYKADSRGRRVAEPKDRVKERVRRSPDDLDAMGLAYYSIGDGWTQHKEINIPKSELIRPDTRGNLFGFR